MRCIVIDDEKPAVDLVCSYIEKVPFLELSGSFTDIGKAVTFIMSGSVDLIFSDIELNSDINGIQLIKSLPDPPMVIFISAYDRYAVDSYALDAVDYLMKPVSKERFFIAVNKAYKQFNSDRLPDTPSVQGLPETVPASDFIFVKTENRLVKIYLTEDRILLSLQSLNKLETVLPDNFVRVHRSFIIALDKISEIEHKRIKINGELIPIGESYIDRFFRKVLPEGRQNV